MEEKSLLEAVTELIKDLREIRIKFHHGWPRFLKIMYESYAQDLPKEELSQETLKEAMNILKESRDNTPEAREKIIETWNRNGKEILLLLNKQFQKSLAPEEIEKRGLSIIELMKEAFLLITEELRLVNLTEAELDRILPEIEKLKTET